MIQLRSVLKNPVYSVLPIIIGSALLCLWRAWCEFPVYSWNEARLAPAFALRYGINPYPPIGGGPLSTWIYGPTGIAINLPATFASSALGALQAACLINFIVLITPLAWVFFRSRDLPLRRSHALCWFTLAVAVQLLPRVNLVLQVADHAAIAFGIFSCWFLTRAARPTALDLSMAAGAGILAVWAKQIEVFLVAAQFGYLLLSPDRSVAVKYILRLLAFGLLTLGVIVWYFGWSNLWLNLVVIPGKLPWTGEIASRIATRKWLLIAQVVIPFAGLACLRFTRHWPDRESQSTRFFLITIYAGIVMLPIGILGFLKIGGDTNLLHSWDYLLPGSLGAWLAVSDKIGAKARPRWIFALTVLCVLLRRDDIFSFPKGPFAGHLDVADKLMSTIPTASGFPAIRSLLFMRTANCGIVRTAYKRDFSPTMDCGKPIFDVIFRPI